MAAPNPLGPRAREIERNLVRATTARLPLKLTALFFALVLWLAVSAEEPTEEWVDVRVTLARDSTVTLLDSVPAVQALVVGRGRDLLRLYTAVPVLRRAVRADSSQRLTIELRPGDVDLPSNVDARVRDVRPSTMTLRVRVAETRRVPVGSGLEVVADSGFRLTGPPTLDPESVTVHGATARVRALTEVYTTRQRIVASDSLRDVTVPLDTLGLGVRVTPAEVHVRVPVARAASDSAARRREPPPS